MRRCWQVALGLLLLLPTAALAAAADPLRVRNLAPASFLYGLPAPQGRALAAGERQLTLHVEHANNFTARRTGALDVYLDGSTTVASLAYRQGLGERWEWGLEVPHVHHGGGFTDGFIDDFHDLFGFPDGGRDAAPRHRLDYRISAAGAPLVDIGSRQRGIGDVRLWGGYRLAVGGDRDAAVRALVKLPSGDVDDLTGSGAADAALWVELADRAWLAALGTTVTMMAGVTAPGDGDLLRARQRDLVASAHLGLHRPVGERLVLRAQLDGHSEVLDTGIRALGGAALQGTLGATVLLARSWRLDLALSEDVVTKSAPDVVFLASLSRRW